MLSVLVNICVSGGMMAWLTLTYDCLPFWQCILPVSVLSGVGASYFVDKELMG